MHFAKNNPPSTGIEALRTLRIGLAGAAIALSAIGAQAQTKGTVRDIQKPPVPVYSNAIPARLYFGHMTKPAPVKPEVFGSYARGCVGGAEELPADGPAWQVMRPSRDRAWGHPKLIEMIKRLASEAKQHDGWNGLLVGDLQQPRGGPMLSGHASHQAGLDADIWLTPMPDHTLSRKERETRSATLMTLDRKRINPKRWTQAHARLIKRAASHKQVARIFVHPPIKKALCDWAGNKGAWLAKVRPLKGHNYHFHIRMKCPAGSPQCKNQAAPSPKDGTGCGGELAYWFSDKPWKKRVYKKLKKRPTIVNGVPIPRKKPVARKTLAWLPKACRALVKIQ